jgi:hypothetical protein
MKFNSVYIPADAGGLEFGIDAVTPVTWHFTPRKIAPKSARYAFGLAAADPAKVASISNPFIGSYNELRDALKP